jgi:hypothetical protein
MADPLGHEITKGREIPSKALWKELMGWMGYKKKGRKKDKGGT